MECPQCKVVMDIVESEAMGQLVKCSKCGFEKAVFFDSEPENFLDGMDEKGDDADAE